MSRSGSTCGATFRFGTRVTGARWEGASRTWHVSTAPADGDGLPAGSITARFVVMATGCLSAAKLPEIPGIGDFRGAAYHTARWPHDGVDFTGLRVGLIGTGSSAVQSVPVVGGVGAYRARCEQVARDGYPGFSLTA